jgi:hypothetical protein
VPRELPVVAALAGLLAACSPDPQAPPEILRIHLDERPVLTGRVIEAIDSPRTADVYLRLELLGGERRWVVLDAPPGGTRLGEWIRVRSLAKRSDVWVAAIERDFDVLEVVALMPRD